MRIVANLTIFIDPILSDIFPNTKIRMAKKKIAMELSSIIL